MDRPQAALIWAQARHLIDAAHTLILAGDGRAKEAVKRALDLVGGTPFKLLAMEAGLLAGRLGEDAAAASRAMQTLNDLEHALGSPEGFKSRWLD